MAKLEREDSVRRLSDLPPLPGFSQGNCGSFNSYAISRGKIKNND